jgi:hypothetical protein
MPRIQPNPNRSGVTPTTSNSNGVHGTGAETYVGAKNAIHIHLVRTSGKHHIKVGKNAGTRRNFDATNKSECDKVVKEWLSNYDKSVKGYAECLKFLQLPDNKRNKGFS